MSKKWEYKLRKKSLPLYADKGLPDEESHQLTSDGTAVRGVPVRFDDGSGEREWIVYKANKLGYAGLYLMDARGEKFGSKALVKGGRSADGGMAGCGNAALPITGMSTISVVLNI